MDKKKIDNSTRNNGMEEGRSGETQALLANTQGVRDYTSSYPQKRDNTSDNELNGMDDSRGNSPKFPSSEEDGESGDLFGLNEESSTFEKIAHLSRRSAPVIISFFLSLSGSLINLLFAGRFVASGAERSVVFAGVSLGNMFANVTCFSLLIGMSSAIETLGSQHNGAGKLSISHNLLSPSFTDHAFQTLSHTGNYEKVALVFQRSCLILLTMTLPMLLLWMFVGNLYEFLGAEQGVCDVIRNYIYIRALGVPGDVLNLSYEKYLMSIGVMQPSMWCNISFNLFLLTLNSIFVFGFGFDFHCLAVAWVLATYLSAFVQITLAQQYSAVQRTYLPWDRRAFDEWWEFIQLGLPGTVMICSEWWAFEILMIFATLLGTAEVAAQTIIQQMSSLSFTIPLGIGITSASFVGNAIGAGRTTLAKQMGRTSIAYTACTNLVAGTTIFFFGHYFAEAFTNDALILAVTRRAIPFLSVFVMIDGIQSAASGVLRGAGKQYIGAVANVIAFYGVGLPMAYMLCFKAGFGVNGLLMGIATGSLIQVSVLLIMIFGFEHYLFDTSVIDVKHSRTCSTDNSEEEGDSSVAMVPVVSHPHPGNKAFERECIECSA